MKITTIAKTSLALGLLTTGVITTTTQAAKASTPSSTKVEAPQSTPPSTKVEAPQSKPNATTPSSTKVEAPQQTANATTPPSTNTPQPMQSTKSDTPQSPTTKQVPTEINPKFKDLRAYYTKPSLEFKNEIGIILKNGRQ